MNKLTVPFLCSLIALASLARASDDATGRPAPLCDLAAMGDLPKVDLRQLRGKVVYVDFWASWCAPCAKAFPFLNDMDREFGERGLQVVGINVDEQIENAQRFLSRHPASFALASDASGQCPRSFAVKAMPASYLVDRKGVIRRVVLGFRAGEAEQIRGEVEQLLAEKTDND